MAVRIGIVGVSGYGGSELLRLVAGHPAFELAYVGGDASAAERLVSRFPALAGRREAELVVRRPRLGLPVG